MPAEIKAVRLIELLAAQYMKLEAKLEHRQLSWGFLLAFLGGVFEDRVTL